MGLGFALGLELLRLEFDLDLRDGDFTALYRVIDLQHCPGPTCSNSNRLPVVCC